MNDPGCGCGLAGGVCTVRGRLRSREEVDRQITWAALQKLKRWRPTLLDGIRVRWLGVAWRGVPEPLRWVLDARLRRTGRMLPRDLPGCGCIDALKALVERLAAALAH